MSDADGLPSLKESIALALNTFGHRRRLLLTVIGLQAIVAFILWLMTRDFRQPDVHNFGFFPTLTPIFSAWLNSCASFAWTLVATTATARAASAALNDEPCTVRQAFGCGVARFFPQLGTAACVIPMFLVVIGV
jgi:hypothetical protein